MIHSVQCLYLGPDAVDARLDTVRNSVRAQHETWKTARFSWVSPQFSAFPLPSMTSDVEIANVEAPTRHPSILGWDQAHNRRQEVATPV